MESPTTATEEAKRVLKGNSLGDYTIPAKGLYPHQWLWDSCFIAIGIRHYDVDRAQAELLRLVSGQWANGMLPHMILSDEHRHVRDAKMWRSWANPHAPIDVATSGITQPPMLAEAVVRVGEKLSKPERKLWYKTMYGPLVKYHQWLHTERDPHQEGLTLQIHPWETGLDNTPPWMKELHEHQMPLWITAVDKLKLKYLIKYLRRDTKRIPAEQRLDTIDALAFYSTMRRLRRKAYDIDRILRHSLFAVEDLAFNCILIRADENLQTIAKTIAQELPEELVQQIEKTRSALEQLWDPYSNQYYPRNFVTHKLIKEPSVATLLPLYAGSITKDRASRLVKQLENENQYGTTYPVPSTPAQSTWFKELGYWQGPAWVNMNWLLIDGLRRYGFDDHAEALKETTLEMVGMSGCYEYFSPLSGEAGGAENFSWTASLYLDLLCE